jgi:hypothetical protein
MTSDVDTSAKEIRAGQSRPFDCVLSKFDSFEVKVIYANRGGEESAKRKRIVARLLGKLKLCL